MKDITHIKIKNGDLVINMRSIEKKPGIVVFSQPSNSYPSMHTENISKIYSFNHYVLFKDFIEGPFLTCELKKVN